MTKRFRCRLGRHRRIIVAVTVEVWPQHHGYTKLVCPDCGKAVRG